MSKDGARRSKVEFQDALPHETLIQSSPYLKHAYGLVYREILDLADAHLVEGVSIEVGAAGGFFSEHCPDLVRSDVRTSKNLDLRLDGMKLPFKDQSLSRIYCKDSLHHMANPQLFFQEAVRCLQPGGGIVCSEPYWGPVAQFIYRYGHSEEFNTKVDSWEFESHSPFDSNQAVLFLLLRKLRLTFVRNFPEIEIIEGRPITGPSYVLSGGASRRSLLPNSLLVKLANLEKRTDFWRRSCGLAYTTVFRVRLEK